MEKNIKKITILVGVLIFGVLIFKYQTSEASVDATADWQTYSDNIHNLSLRYPKNFTYSGLDIADKGVVNFEADGPNGEQFFIYTNNLTGPYTPPQGTTISDWILNTLKWKPASTEQKIQIAGLPTMQLSINGTANQFFFIKNGNMFHVTIKGTDINSGDSNSLAMNFLQSFKFKN